MPDIAPPAVDPRLGPLVERQRPALWRYARTLGADREAADDLVQEAVLVALRRPGFDAGAPGGVFAFLRATVRHLWLRSRRVSGVDGAAREREVADADRVWDERCAGGGGNGDDYVEALRACVAALPERSRELLRATYADGDGRAAAARRLGIGNDGVKSALRRLRAFLHDCIRARIAKEDGR